LNLVRFVIVETVLATFLCVEALPQENEGVDAPERTTSVFAIQIGIGFPEYFTGSASIRTSEHFYVGAKLHTIVLGRRDNPDGGMLASFSLFGFPYETGTGWGPTISYFFDPSDSGMIITDIQFEASTVTSSSLVRTERDQSGAAFQLLACHGTRKPGTVVGMYGAGLVLVARKGLTPSLTPTVRVGVQFNT